MDQETRNHLIAEFLCIADTDWVLGHWYIKVMMNGRSLTDCSSFAGIAQDTLGHTRAIFKFMEDEFGMPEHQLEFGRDRDQIHDMEMLSAPPENWGDFLVSAYLAEGAVWSLLSTFKGSSHAGIAGMVTHFGKELYFHRLGLEGWLKSAIEDDRDDMIDATSRRLALAVRWFGETEGDDPLLLSGLRDCSVAHAKAAWLESTVSKLAGILDVDLNTEVDAPWDDFDVTRRRTGGSQLPATLWEFMIPTDTDTVVLRRPLAVSVDDNLDLFDRPEYAQVD